MNLEKMIYEYFDEHRLGVEEVDVDSFFVNITIERGDWKHEHLRCDWLLEEMCKENNLHLLIGGINVTEEDGSDTYSAIHHYFICPN